MTLGLFALLTIKLIGFQKFHMKTIDNFFNSAQNYPFQDRQSKIEELRKPVYSKKIKQRKHRDLFGSTEFIAFSDLQKTITKAALTTAKSFRKVKRSNSDLFLSRKKESSFDQQTKAPPLGDNLIIEKLQYDKSTGKLAIHKNNFIKTLSQIAFSGNTHIRQKLTKKQEKLNQEDNIFKRSPNIEKKKQEKHLHKTQEKLMDRKQNLKMVEILKKEEIQQCIVGELNLLRKKRHSLGQENGIVDSSKKESLIRRNSLFLMNYLKQKEKQFESGKQPHINFMRNTAQNIKIQENMDLRKNILSRMNGKIEMRSKVEQQKSEKINRIFNTMKIEPW